MYTSNEKYEYEIRKTILFITTSKRIKTINLTEVQNIF